jgi:hypothetical protein
MSPESIKDYCNNNRTQDEDIELVFDMNECKLTARHALSYVAHLKVDCTFVNFSDRLLLEYMRTPHLLGKTNLIAEHANFLRGGRTIDCDLAADIKSNYTDVISSLPLYLMINSNISESHKAVIVSMSADDRVLKNHFVGANLFHLVSDNTLFLEMLGDNVYNFNTHYHTQLFDDYMYGGDRLIYAFEQSNNLLLDAITHECQQTYKTID